MQDFGTRHRDTAGIFDHHAELIANSCPDPVSSFSTNKKRLLGAYFTKEYSIQSAALFNPSIVPHPHQIADDAGNQRFVMSLRATGEGHISSIAFHTGTISADGNVTLDPPSPYFTPLPKNEVQPFTLQFAKERVGEQSFLLEGMSSHFTAAEALTAVKRNAADKYPAFLEKVSSVFDSNYTLQGRPDIPINEKVIFPSAAAESMGMEDVRFVRFTDGSEQIYYGTYTAYNGHEIKSQLIETTDFDVFHVRTLYGDAISDKGMALFPEKVDGKYVMISRQGGEVMNIMFSDNLYRWDSYQTLLSPEYDWEMVQLGNCGSPVKTDRGWLLLMHGVGAVRTYVISALLLDLHDPSKIIGRLSAPLIAADETEREGYVPNVVYTCGLLMHGDILFIPYAVSDSAIGFATVNVNELLNEMTKK